MNILSFQCCYLRLKRFSVICPTEMTGKAGVTQKKNKGKTKYLRAIKKK